MKRVMDFELWDSMPRAARKGSCSMRMSKWQYLSTSSVRASKDVGTSPSNRSRFIVLFMIWGNAITGQTSVAYPIPSPLIPFKLHIIEWLERGCVSGN